MSIFYVLLVIVGVGILFYTYSIGKKCSVNVIVFLTILGFSTFLTGLACITYQVETIRRFRFEHTPRNVIVFKLEKGKKDTYYYEIVGENKILETGHYLVNQTTTIADKIDKELERTEIKRFEKKED